MARDGAGGASGKATSGKTTARKTTSRTQTLGWVLAGAAAALLMVVIGFVAMAHRSANHWLEGLPKHLGANIQQETNGFTYDQSVKGRKVFTVHASKEVQHKDGTIGLHDVGIVLYGPHGEVTDRIHGADFLFDTKAQVISAKGEVFIELVRPQKEGEPAVDESARLVHVKTIGLVFRQKEQVATTDGAVEFHAGGYTGNSVGASFDAQAGLVVLNSAVRMSGLRDEKPVLLTATRAQMDHATSLIDLVNAKYVSAGDGGSESLAARHAVVRTTSDGTPQHMDADGDVRLTGDRQGTVLGDRMKVDLGPKGQARLAHLMGHVRFVNDQDGKAATGHSDEAVLEFDEAGLPRHAVMTGGVNFEEHGPVGERALEAEHVEMALTGGGRAPVIVRSGVAYGNGGARLQLMDAAAKGKSTTEVHAERLTGRFAAGGKTTELTGLDGSGRSTVIRTATGADGRFVSRDTSEGDALRVAFTPGADGRSELTRAEQRGAVTTLREAVVASGAKKGQTTIEHGRADDAVYEAASDTVHMTGSVVVRDEASELLADRLDVDRTSGDAKANGAVRVTYLSGAGSGAGSGAESQEPVHVLAVRAVAHKSSGLAEFFGDASAKARMWQGASQVEAPVIDLYRKEKRLVAHGEAGQEGAVVRTLLVGADAPKGAASGAARRPQGPVRVLSREVVYTDDARTVEFSGAVRVEDRDGTMTAKVSTVWLASQGKTVAAGAGSGMFGGKIDHMVSTGGVEIEQPGRKATGEKLVYTASDGVFVLTGTKAVAPRVVDQTQGTTTGAALRFKTGDDSVVVLGDVPGTAPGDQKTAGRVRSETRMK